MLTQNDIKLLETFITEHRDAPDSKMTAHAIACMNALEEVLRLRLEIEDLQSQNEQLRSKLAWSNYDPSHEMGQ